MEFLKEADAIVGEKARALYDIWRQCAGERVAPRRADITLSRVRALTPWMWTVDAIDGGSDFRFRLAGHEANLFLGAAVTGLPLSRVAASRFTAQLQAALSRGVVRRTPVALGPMRSDHAGKEHWEVELVALPLSEDGQTVTALVGALQLWPLGTNTR
jgi:hypothetical protein